MASNYSEKLKKMYLDLYVYEITFSSIRKAGFSIRNLPDQVGGKSSELVNFPEENLLKQLDNI